MRVAVPPGWDAGVDWHGAGYTPIVHLATFPLPRDLGGGHEAERLLRPGDVYVNIGVDPGFAAAEPLGGLRIGRPPLEEEWEGKVPEASRRAAAHVLAGRHLLQLWVTFGSPPTDVELRAVNDLLQSLRADPVG